MHFKANTLEVDFSIKNLPSLTSFYLSISVFGICIIDEKILTRLLDQVPHIQELHLNGDLSYLNFDSFVNLRQLSLSGKIKDNFNLKLFKNLCNQLEDIQISLRNINEQKLFKLFDGYNFPYLRGFTLMRFSSNRLKKEFISRFQTLRHLNITDCEIELIEHDSFSNLQQLTSLNLSCNLIELIEKNAFSDLKNLQTLDLRHNKLTKFDRNYIGLGNSVEVKIEYNYLNS